MLDPERYRPYAADDLSKILHPDVSTELDIKSSLLSTSIPNQEVFNTVVELEESCEVADKVLAWWKRIN